MKHSADANGVGSRERNPPAPFSRLLQFFDRAPLSSRGLGRPHPARRVIAHARRSEAKREIMSGKAASKYRVRLQAADPGRPIRSDRRRQRAGQTAGLRRLIAREPARIDVDSIPKVTDDFPHAIPVIPRELDVIETYLGALLDAASGTSKDPESPENSVNVS